MPDEALRHADAVSVAVGLGGGPGGLGRGGGGRQIAGPERDPASLDERPDAVRRVERRGREGRIEVARGGRQIATTSMDPPERDLDTREAGRVGQRRGRLQLRDRRRILPEPSEQLADPRMERDRRPADRARSPPGDDRSPLDWRTTASARSAASQNASAAGPGSTGFTLVDGDQRIPRQVVATGRRRDRAEGQSAVRAWSSRRRARLVPSYAASRNRPWLKS